MLLILSHPAYDESVANKIIIDKVSNNDKIVVHHLDKVMVNGQFDVKKEQELLLQHDQIVFQFPLYWYTCPSSLKAWMDQVFEHGFAFGSTGDKLKGKELLVSVTVGGKKEAYCSEGYNSHEVTKYLLSFTQVAKLTQMNFKGFTVSFGHGASKYLGEEYPKSALEEIDTQVQTIVNMAK